MKVSLNGMPAVEVGTPRGLLDVVNFRPQYEAFTYESVDGGRTWKRHPLIDMRGWETFALMACPRCRAPLVPAGHCSRRNDGCQGGWGEVRRC